MADFHRIKITCPKGEAVLTRIELDGQELRGATFVGFAVGIEKGVAEVTLRLFADVEIEGEAEIIKEWRAARIAPSCDHTDTYGRTIIGGVCIACDEPVAV